MNNNQLDQQITNALQGIDNNFVTCHEIASRILLQVKRYNKNVKHQGELLNEWKLFFNHIHVEGNKRRTSSSTMNTPLHDISNFSRASYLSTDPAKKEKKPNDRKLSSSSSLYSDNLATPVMPRFRTSFAKTPAVYPPINNISFSTSVSSNSVANQVSPPISTPFYKPSKTPGKDHLMMPPPSAKNDNSIQSLSFSTPSMHNYGSNNTNNTFLSPPINMTSTPLTPPTPIDGNYGPASAVKIKVAKEKGISIYSTPRNRGSKINFNCNDENDDEESDVSTEVDTPCLKSPLNTTVDIDIASMTVEKPKTILKSALKAKSAYATPSPITPKPNSPLMKKDDVADNDTNNSNNDSRDSLVFDASFITNLASAQKVKPVQSDLYEDDDDDEAMNAPPPQFDLGLFPAPFRRGEGAKQITAVYDQFNGSSSEQSMRSLIDLLPGYNQSRIELLLELLVSRRLLRPFEKKNAVYWRPCGE